MKYATYSERMGKLNSILISFVSLFLVIFLTSLRVDNIFWYKSAMLSYAISSILYLSYPLLKNALLGRIATWSLFFSLLINLTAMIRRGIQSYELGVFHPPWSNLFEALTFWSFIAGSVYLLVERKYSFRILGAFLVPLLFILSAFAIFRASKDITPAHASS
ncbi:MAG: hypothetical protein ACK4SM_02050 [Aquificaceae bacterium]